MYYAYLISVGGPIVILIGLILSSLELAGRIGADIWLSMWTSQSQEEQNRVRFLLHSSFQLDVTKIESSCRYHTILEYTVDYL